LLVTSAAVTTAADRACAADRTLPREASLW